MAEISNSDIGFLINDNAAQLLVDRQSNVAKQHDGKVFYHLKEFCKTMGKFDKPQASLKTCVKNMFLNFIEFLKLRARFINTRTIGSSGPASVAGSVDFKNHEEKILFLFVTNYSEYLNNLKDLEYRVIDTYSEAENTLPKKNSGTVILTEYYATNDQITFEEFKKKFEITSSSKIFDTDFTNFQSELLNFNLNDMFKNFINNIRRNNYSYLSSILKGMSSTEAARINKLLDVLFNELYSNTPLLNSELMANYTTLNDTDFLRFLTKLETEITKKIHDWANANFKADYYLLSYDEKKKIQNIFNKPVNITDAVFFKNRENLLKGKYDFGDVTSIELFNLYFDLYDVNDEQDENLDEHNITNPSFLTKAIRLNIKKLTYDPLGGALIIDNEFYGIFITIAVMLIKKETKFTKTNLIGGEIYDNRLLSNIEKLRKTLITKDEINFSKLQSFEEQLYAAYDLLFDFFIDYDPNNLIDIFLKSHYSSRGLKNCSKELQSVVLSRNLRDYVPEKGGNAINHGALLQGLVEQLGGNNLAYDMYLSDTTLQLHNNELEHSIMSDIMRGGSKLDPTHLDAVIGKPYFNIVNSINDIFCKFNELIGPLKLSTKSISMIEGLFENYMKTHVQIMRTLDIAKALKDKDADETVIEGFVDHVKNNQSTNDFQKILDDINNLKNIQNAQLVQLTSVTNSIASLITP